MVGMKKVAVVALVVVVLTLTACSDSAPATERDHAERVGWAFCELMGRCNHLDGEQVRSCVTVYVNGVCNNYDCDKPTAMTEEDVERCVAELEEHACAVSPYEHCDDVLR